MKTPECAYDMLAGAYEAIQRGERQTIEDVPMVRRWLKEADALFAEACIGLCFAHEASDCYERAMELASTPARVRR